MTVLCVNSSTVYADIASAVAAEAGINYGVPTDFEQTGTSTGAVTFSGGSFASGINYYAVAGEETTGDIAIGAQCSGIITSSVNPLTISNLRTQRINDLVTTSIYTNLVGNGQGSQDVFTNGTFDNCIAHNCSEGWRGGDNAVTVNCTVVDATGIGFLSSKCTGAAALNTSNSAYVAPASGSVNYWADDSTGSDAITETTKTDIFENYAIGDYRIKPTSSVGVAGAGAFINSGGVIALEVDSVSNLNTLSESSLVTQSISFAVDNITNAQSLSNINLTQNSAISIDDLINAQSLSQPTLTQANILSVNYISNNQSLSDVTLSVASALSVDSIANSQLISDVSLSAAGQLSLDDVSNAQLTSSAELIKNHQFIVDSISNLNVLDVSSLNTDTNFIVQSISSAQTITSSGLIQHNILLVDSISNAQLLGVVTFNEDTQEIGTVTAAFKENDISVKYGVINLTVKFKE